MTDRIIMEEMVFFGYHGVLPEETKLGQLFAVTVFIDKDLHKAAVSDNLGDTLDYSLLYRDIKAVMEGPPRKLLETIAEEIAILALSHGADKVNVTVKKKNPPLPGKMDFVAVEVERGR